MSQTQTAIAPQVPDDPDPEVAYILDLEAKLEAAVAASQAIYCDEDIEVDSSPDMFGVLYRVWRGIKLLGTFWRSPEDGLWMAEPFCCRDRQRYDTPQQAQSAIVSAWDNSVEENALCH